MLNNFVQNLALQIYNQKKSAADDDQIEEQKKQIMGKTWDMITPTKKSDEKCQSMRPDQRVTKTTESLKAEKNIFHPKEHKDNQSSQDSSTSLVLEKKPPLTEQQEMANTQQGDLTEMVKTILER